MRIRLTLTLSATLAAALLPGALAAEQEAGGVPATESVPDTTQAAEESPIAVEASSDSGANWFALPALAYAPETSLLLGVAAIASRSDRGLAEPLQSSVFAAATYTLRGQGGAALRGSYYFSADRWLLEGKLYVFRWNEFYFGVGDDPPLEGDRYQFGEGRFELALLRRAGQRRLFLGPIMRASRLSVLQADEPALLAEPGGEGHAILGLGGQLSWDGRDRSLWTQRGVYLQAIAVGFHEGFVSDATFAELDLDARVFLPAPWGFVLGAQLAARSRRGGVPFFRQALIGGGGRLRGTFRGRYRDDFGAYTQLELRTPYLWRLPIPWGGPGLGRIAAVAFGGVGAVAPNVGALPDAAPVPSFGAGLRVSVNDDGANIRIDYGRTHEEDGFYFSLGEAF